MRYFTVVFLSFLVVACGGGGDSSSSSNTPTAPINNRPVANAGVDAEVNTGESYALDGSNSSDANGDTLTYKWTIISKPEESNLIFNSSSSPTLIFTPDVDGEYQIGLVVNDGSLDSISNTVIITSTTPNIAPIANAGADSSVVVNTSYILDGSGSTDENNSQLTYIWNITDKPDGSNIELNEPFTSTESNASFTPDFIGDYIISLTVNDGELTSNIDNIIITAVSANIAPIANAGEDQTIETGSTIALDASASTDPNGDTLTYIWNVTSKPETSTKLLNSSTETSLPTINLTADVDGEYTVTVTVTDGELISEPSTVTITAFTPNRAPQLSIEGNNWVFETRQLNNVINSSDADEDALTFTISGVDADLFLIDDGSLFLNTLLDFESPIDTDSDNIYDISITASDGEAEVTEEFSLEVKNINELTDDFSIRKYSAGDFTQFITTDSAGQRGTFTQTFTENTEDISYLVSSDDVQLFRNWSFNSSNLLTFKLIQSQPDDGANGALLEYAFVDFGSNNYCSNYVNDVCETIVTDLSDLTVGNSNLSNFYARYTDISLFSDLYSTTGSISLISEEIAFFHSDFGNNQAYEVLVVDIERVFAESNAPSSLESISGSLFIFPPLGIVGGLLNINHNDFGGLDTEYRVLFKIDNTNIQFTEN